MRGTGFEPVQALSYDGLNVAHLTALASPPGNSNKSEFIEISDYCLIARLILTFTDIMDQQIKT